ncbi:MAG TPA: hypothetical protein VN256_00405 [Pyrinomonadaceae bacterium]|nr:hypothetical protein [Pyrinomonadaceae bacterium]
MRHLLPLLFVLMATSPALDMPGGQSDNSADTGGDIAITGSLSELKYRRRVLLLVRRSAVVDSRGGAEALLKEAYAAAKAGAPLRYPRIYNLLAQHLNRYMNKYQSISAARGVPDAEFIIFFNLLEFRRPLGYPYPYGELIVIVNDTENGNKPRVVWKTRKSPMWVEDAVKDFIRDLKAVRGEE